MKTKTYITHKGGVVTHTPTGLIHRAPPGAYAEQERMSRTKVKQSFCTDALARVIATSDKQK